MDDTEELLGVRYIGIVAFSILGRLHFQLLTICQQLICAFFFQTLLQFRPIVTCAALVWLPARAWRRRTKTAGRPPAPDAAPTPTAPSGSVAAQTDAAASGPSDLPSQKEQQTENPDA